MSNTLWSAKASEVSPEEFAAIEAEERLVYEAQKAVRNLLRHKALKASDLARMLGVSEARVSQMLGGEAKNLTLRTLARIFHALGSRGVVTEQALEARQTVGSVREKAAESAATMVTDTREEPVQQKQHVSRARIDLDLWSQLGDQHLLSPLPDDAAFGKQAAWILGPEILPANENERLRRTSPQEEEAARSWMEAPLPFQHAREREYA